jgi:HSP20 family molecular chaperone IbpA
MSDQEVARSGSNGGLTKDQNGRSPSTESALRPDVDIFETGEGITLQADMPGVSKDRLNLHVDGTNLLIEGRIGITPQDQMQPLYADIRSAVYRRTFLLSNEFETDKIDANLKDGVLTVRIPKRAELRPRRIEVRSG